MTILGLGEGHDESHRGGVGVVGEGGAATDDGHA